VAQKFLGGFSRLTGKVKIPVRPVTNAFQYYYHFYTNKYPKTLYHDNPVRPVKEKRKKAHNSDSTIHRSDGAVVAQKF
jgi:hypothetical protein